MPLARPSGAPLPFAPPCMRQRRRPFTAGDWQGVPVRVLAPHRSAWRIFESRRTLISVWCMGSSKLFSAIPHPLLIAGTAENGLCTLVKVHVLVLDDDLLNTAAPDLVEAFELRGIGP